MPVWPPSAYPSRGAAAFDVCGFSILFVGQSGAHKTTVAQLLLNYFSTAYSYGSRPSAPIVWTASEPILRRTLYTCKDAILLRSRLPASRRRRRPEAGLDDVAVRGHGRGRQTMSQLYAPGGSF